MKKLYLLLTAVILCGAVASSQNIKVKDFKLLDRDLTANTEGTKRIAVQDGSVAALIKVVTTEKGFNFNVEGDATWSVVNEAAWISLDKNTGTGSGTVKVSVAENASAPQRQGGDGTFLSYNDAPMVKYTRHSKKQYIDKLRRVFKNNAFVNIHFADNDVVKMGKGGEVYGIQIKQDYYSQHYGDTGYLFLLVDINDPEHPVITVRTWQPDRDPNINNRLPKDNPDYGLIGAGNF